MPISDVEGYDIGHFKRVYEYIIKPACLKSGFTPIRADDVKKTNVIVIDILQKLLNSEMAICDLSTQNPNVLYELGIRQAFDLPVSFIKDNITKRIFDIQGFRDIEYDRNLRIDEVNKIVDALAINILETYESKGEDVNSIVELLGISKAKINHHVEISPDTEIILKSLHDISLRLGNMENLSKTKLQNEIIADSWPGLSLQTFTLDDEIYKKGDIVSHPRFGLGSIEDIKDHETNGTVAIINFDSVGRKSLILKFSKFTKQS